MLITPWSIYDRPFKSNSKPAIIKIHSKEIIPNPNPNLIIKPSNHHKHHPQSSVNLNHQHFYSYSPSKQLQKHMSKLLTLQLIHKTLEESQPKCISLPKINNPPKFNKIRPVPLKHKKKQKKSVVMNQEEINFSYRRQVENNHNNLLDESPFNDQKIIRKMMLPELKDRERLPNKAYDLIRL